MLRRARSTPIRHDAEVAARFMRRLVLQLIFPILLILAILALRGVRWAYATYVFLGLLYFPARVGFRMNPHACQLGIDLPLALFSLSNYPHVVLFAFFFVMTTAQFRTDTRSAFLWAGLMTLAMGTLVEIAEGITGRGNCRLRDLVPDAAGALLGTVTVLLWTKARMPARAGDPLDRERDERHRARME